MIRTLFFPEVDGLIYNKMKRNKTPTCSCSCLLHVMTDPLGKSALTWKTKLPLSETRKAIYMRKHMK